MTYILGLNAFHADSSACLFHDGEMIAAVEEERLRRIKHWAGFPTESIRYCLQEAGITLADVQWIALNQDTTANLSRKLQFLLTNRPDMGLILDRIRNRRERSSVQTHLAELPGAAFFKGRIQPVEHHLAHMASAFHVSPFDNAVAVSVDGFGDFASTAWGLGQQGNLEVDGRVFFPHSLGIFYQALTQFIGFPNYGDEYKVMGLAPYGKPVFLQQMRKLVKLLPDGQFRLNLDYFVHHREKIRMEWDGGVPVTAPLFSAQLESLLGPARRSDEPLTQHHRDIAHSVQCMYEEALFNLLCALHEQYRQDAVVLAGGCAMNSVANGKIRLRTPFRHVYVQSAAGDAGGAIGAALSVWHRNCHESRNQRRTVHNHAYWGPAFSDDAIDAALVDRSEEVAASDCQTVRVEQDDVLVNWTAARIADGCVVGWFQDRLEWGPRALGNRSIVCDPRRSDMKDVLNLKIKRRESFRPFAPSVLQERVVDWFEQDGQVPFMMEVWQIRKQQRSRIPAVTHVDGSGRLQTVSAQGNPRYHALISAFESLTGVPMVLNTSFNENEPVVCTPAQALDCFLRTRMDVLVMGNRVLYRPGVKPVWGEQQGRQSQSQTTLDQSVHDSLQGATAAP